MNKRFCLIVFVVLFAEVLVLILDKRNIARSGRCDYDSGEGFVCFLIVLLSAMAVNVVILSSERDDPKSPQSKHEQKDRRGHDICFFNLFEIAKTSGL